jgi:hypothetical protein
MFPSLANKAQPSSMITNFLREVEDIPDLDPDASGHGLRIGAVNELANVPGISEVHITVRGGWKMENFNTMFEYLLAILRTLNVGGRALAGWKNPFVGAALFHLAVLLLMR